MLVHFAAEVCRLILLEERLASPPPPRHASRREGITPYSLKDTYMDEIRLKDGSHACVRAAGLDCVLLETPWLPVSCKSAMRIESTYCQ